MTNLRRPIRVLQIVGVMDRAGVETWLMHLLRRLDRRDVAVDLAVQTARPGAYDAEIRSLGVRIRPCVRPRFPWLYVPALARVLREWGPYDVVHSQSYFFSGVDLMLAARAGVGIRIAHIHPYRDLREGKPFNGLYRTLLSRWIARYSTCILAPSYATLESFGRFVDLSAKPCAVIRNCVDLAAYRHPLDRVAARARFGFPADRPVIVYVARFDVHKNHKMLLRVADQLAQAGVPAHFAMAGSDGVTRRQIQERIASRPEFSLFVDLPEVTALLRCSDLFLFPSLEEGFGTVAVEAAAAGLPVVATGLPSIREACAPGHWAYAFPPDDEKAAARSVQAILGDPELAVRLAAEGRAWAEGFSIDPVLEQLCGIYRSGLPEEPR